MTDVMLAFMFIDKIDIFLLILFNLRNLKMQKNVQVMCGESIVNDQMSQK